MVKRKGWSWTALVAGVVAVGLIYPLLMLGTYAALPSGNTAATHFDTIVVLGTPSRPDGTPTPEQRERVVEGVEEFRRGVAGHIIMTGGSAHNQFVEAHTMALLAQQMGVPAGSVLEEAQAKDTIQNIFYSVAIMREHGWGSAEVVSSPSHLPRTGLILEHWPIQWRTHAAHWPVEYGWGRRLGLYWGEAYVCWRVRRHGFKASSFLPAGLAAGAR